MPSWEEDLKQILSQLGVEQEAAQPAAAPAPQHVEPFFITFEDRRRPGISYRLDTTEDTPELRVYVPSSEGAYKVRVYLVQLVAGSFLSHLFGMFMSYEGGSVAFQQIMGGATYHMFFMLLHTMKDLFWLGDMDAFQFPPEISVQCLL